MSTELKGTLKIFGDNNGLAGELVEEAVFTSDDGIGVYFDMRAKKKALETLELVIAQQKADIDRLHNLLAEECGARKRAEQSRDEWLKMASDCEYELRMIKEPPRPSRLDDGFDKPGKDFKYV